MEEVVWYGGKRENNVLYCVFEWPSRKKIRPLSVPRPNLCNIRIELCLSESIDAALR